MWPKINISGTAVAPIVDAVVDIFSPATETLAFLGDTIRVHRTRTVLKCFARTKKIAEDAGLNLKVPPTKFLTQYIENASLEEEDDKTLVEWWARLLCDAGTHYDAKHVFFTSVLKQISKKELELLEVLARNGQGSYRLEHIIDAEFLFDFNAPQSDLTLATRFTDTQIKKSVASIRAKLSLPGALLLDIFIDDVASQQFQDFHPDYGDEELPSWQILHSLQLVRLGYVNVIREEVNYRVRTVVMTALGAEFYFACHDPSYPNKLSNRARFKRSTILRKPRRRR